MIFYVYEWYDKNNGKVFYVGKGCKKRFRASANRNSLFKEYFNTHKCEYRILGEYEDEKLAFKIEEERIDDLRKIGQAFCNINKGGSGGFNSVWDELKRKEKSTNNPMKKQEQRDRMSKNNPMYNIDTRQKVSKTKSKIVICKGKEYSNAKQLAEECKVKKTTIYYWISRGYARDLSPCYYKENGEKPFVIKNHETSNKAVIIDGVKFKSVKTAADNIGVWSDSLIRAIKNNKKCKGHYCEYANQQPSLMNLGKSSEKGSTTNG